MKQRHFSGTFVVTRDSWTAETSFLELFIRNVIIGLLPKLYVVVSLSKHH